MSQVFPQLFLDAIPSKRLTREEFDLILSNQEFRLQLILYQEKHFLNIDIIPFVREASKSIASTCAKGKLIYVAPGDSPSKFLDFQKYMDPCLCFIEFPLSFPVRDQINIKKLAEYLSIFFQHVALTDMPRLCFVDYIVTGATKRYIEKALSELYNINFTFSFILNLKNTLDLDNIRDAESTLTRAVMAYPFNGIKNVDEGDHDQQIKGHNIFMLLSLFYYQNPEEYRLLTKKISESDECQQSLNKVFSLSSYVGSIVDITYINNDYTISENCNILLGMDCDILLINNNRIYPSQVLSIERKN